MNMDGWDIALYLLAGYLALRTLVWMMAARRDGLVEQLRQEMERRREEEERERKKERRRPRQRTEEEEEAKAA